jgi:N-acetylmuramoyl-L-alanine amidase
VEIVCQALIEKYNIKEIVGHDDIAPGRKVDPGPAFPMQKLKDKILFGRNDDNDNDEITESVVHGKGMVTADFLNIRTKPDINSLKVTEPLARGTKLNILDKKGDWYYVNVDMQGWVYGKWVQTSGDIS